MVYLLLLMIFGSLTVYGYILPLKYVSLFYGYGRGIAKSDSGNGILGNRLATSTESLSSLSVWCLFYSNFIIKLISIQVKAHLPIFHLHFSLFGCRTYIFWQLQFNFFPWLKGWQPLVWTWSTSKSIAQVAVAAIWFRNTLADLFDQLIDVLFFSGLIMMLLGFFSSTFAISACFWLDIAVLNLWLLLNYIAFE